MEYKLRDKLILLGVALVFFISSLILVAGMPWIFVSPDALANFTFTQTMIDNLRLYLFEPLNLSLDDSLFPRSMFSIEGRLVPISFVGLPLIYGAVGKVVGLGLVKYFTPVVAVLALFAWRSVVEKLYDRRVALIASVLLAVHPAWWYYTSRTMMHNVLFVALLIFAVWFLFVRPLSNWSTGKSKYFKVYQHLDVILSGLMLGGALLVRTSEIAWIAPAIVVVVIFFAKQIKWRQAVLFGLVTAVVIAPVFLINSSLYGDPLSFGYMAQSVGSDAGNGVTSLEQDNPANGGVSPDTDTSILPAGLDLRAMARHSVYYGLGLFWWMSLLTLIGIPLAYRIGRTVRSRKTGRWPGQWAFHTIFLIAGAILVLIYGSWTFNDNPDPNIITIANSYVRYWLPVFVMTTVYAAVFIDRGWFKLQQGIRTDRLSLASTVLLIVVVALLGARATFLSPDDGLIYARQNLVRSVEIKSEVLSLTEEDSVIVVDHGDKIFFPERAVIYPLRSDHTYEMMPSIVLRNPLYYYGITFPETDLEYLNTKRLAELGLQIELIQTFDEESLYRIYQP